MIRSLVSARFKSAMEKSFLLAARLSELAPSGAWVEGLIQAARCRTRCLTELLAPASGGPYSPGGLFSPNMSYLQSEKSCNGRAPFLLFRSLVGGSGHTFYVLL
jgi:hypothetical protein